MTTILASCQCGARFGAKPELAGKRVKCPSCGQPFTVPKLRSDPIRVTCECGQTVKAKAELAGRTVKCPSCDQPLVIPQTATLPDNDPLGSGDFTDPLGIGVAGTSDPLGSGNAGFDPLAVGSLPAAPAPPSMPAAPFAANQPAKPSRKQRRQQLTTAAGYVAIGYGGFQMLLCGVLLVRGIIVAVNTGLVGASSVDFVWNGVFLALAFWLAKLGREILQGDRDALDHAGQACMVYIALALLQLVFMGIGLVLAIGMARGNALGVVLFLAGAAVFRVILILPPAFILYVGRLYPSRA